MRFLPCSLLTCAIVFQASCCQPVARKQPVFPGKYEVWQEIHQEGFSILGNFVLNEKESTDNGIIGVRLLKVELLECMSPFAEPPQAAVVFQLYDGRSQHVLCEKRFVGGGGDFDCSPDSKIYSVQLAAINTKDKWVSFDLRRLDQ